MKLNIFTKYINFNKKTKEFLNISQLKIKK